MMLLLLTQGTGSVCASGRMLRGSSHLLIRTHAAAAVSSKM